MDNRGVCQVGTNIFLKIFFGFLGAKKGRGVGGILERGGGVRRAGFSTLTSTAFDG